MPDIFDETLTALGALSTYIESLIPSTTDLINQYGWSTSVLNADQIAERLTDLIARIEKIPDVQKSSEDFIRWLKPVPAVITRFQAHVAPNLAGGSASIVCSMLEQMAVYIEGRLPPENWPIEWEQAAQAGQLPTKLARRLRALEANLNTLSPRAGLLEEKMRRIEDAHEAAESLPTDLATLEEAKARLRQATEEIDRLTREANADRSAVASNLDEISAKSVEAVRLMANIDTAYRASTSKALADAFAKRSYWLQVQTWVFVGLLMLSLLAAGYLGFRRVGALEKMIESGRDISSSILWMNMCISVFSIGAPVWFAWIATKQITQRFKLAEDYGFKAAVANAYEGYRREAAAVDPMFVTRLFGSALARLEEAPLRLVDEENYGSPFHELTASPGFRDALGLVPALRDKYQSVLKSMTSKVRQGAQEAVSTKSAATSSTQSVVDAEDASD